MAESGIHQRSISRTQVFTTLVSVTLHSSIGRNSKFPVLFALREILRLETLMLGQNEKTAVATFRFVGSMAMRG